MINAGWIAAAAAHSVWWNFLFIVCTKGISVATPMALWKMQSESSSIFLFWLPSWAQTPKYQDHQDYKMLQRLGQEARLGPLTEEGWSVTFKIMLGNHTTVLSQKSHGNRERQPAGILASEWNAHILKCIGTRGSMWRHWKHMQPLAFPKFWDLAWYERKDCNYFLLVDRIIDTWKEGVMGSNQEW